MQLVISGEPMARLNVRARAVDLLGRQQVAGIPTAISELFKNAHDAYARTVAVDFFRGPGLFVLRDDGLGMSRQDFENRWLTIGTESKAGGSGLAPPPRDESQPVRPITGEKGIGRLAIALIGSQVLALTRPKGAEEDTLTCAFINWSVFRLPGVDLADIEIPIRELPGGSLPDLSLVLDMANEAQRNVESFDGTDEAMKARIVAEMKAFRFDPSALVLPDPRLDLRTKTGTQFWISPVNEVLTSDIDEGKSADAATPLQKVLLGFANTMTPGHELPPVEVAFRDHLGEGLSYERIADDNFFTPEEFESADHRIRGRFDLRGQFAGSISVYGGDPVEYSVHWSNNTGEDTACGPFEIDFAYVQGNVRESRLARDEWTALTEKLQRLGGLYIYRNGIRILPYGDTDYDFLNIETRRTKGSGYYFFSYRRMFGVVKITSEENGTLVEKAGREGFQENRAYRQFRGMLENLFVQTAADFFRDEGVHAPAYLREKQRLTKEQELLARRRRQVGPQRAALQSALDRFHEALANERFEDEVRRAVSEAEQQFRTAAGRSLSTGDLLGRMREVRSEIADLDRAMTIARPRALGLTRGLSRDWSSYEAERARLSQQLLAPAYERLDELVAETADRLDLDLSTRMVVADVLDRRADEERRRVRSLRNDVERTAEEARQRAVDLARKSFEQLDAVVKTTLIDFEHLDDSELRPDRFAGVRDRLEQEIITVAESRSELLDRLREQLRSSATLEGMEREDVAAALESELEERRERDTENLQLAQMGMAIGIVHHEFQSVIRVVRQNVRRLKSWADRNSGLTSLYEDISKSYSHLDGYLSLFAPLNRKLGAQKREVTGLEIERYLLQLLGARLDRHGITLRATTAFREATVNELVATIYPAFVNMVDNSLHWMNAGAGSVREGEVPRARDIALDFDGRSFVITDGGPGVLPGDQDAVFESGFSRKPGGSGLGLYITRTLLTRAGYDLSLDPYKRGSGATFRITPPLDAIVRPEHDAMEQ